VVRNAKADQFRSRLDGLRLVLEYGCYGVSHCYFSCCCARSECDGSSCAMAVPPRRCARMLASETHGGGPDATAVPLAGIEARRRRKQVCTEQRIWGEELLPALLGGEDRELPLAPDGEQPQGQADGETERHVEIVIDAERVKAEIQHAHDERHARIKLALEHHRH